MRGLDQSSSTVYLGIKYGVAERWKSADLVRFEPFVNDSFTTDPPSCMQCTGYNCFGYGQQSVRVSEDCLYLNVYRPKKVQATRPAMVLIHGGGNVVGTGHAPFNRMTGWSDRGYLCATMNYRLGAFGFLRLPSVPKNLGLRDQALALHWLGIYLPLFGAFEKIAVVGHSSGASAVAHHIRHHPSYFHKAIMLAPRLGDDANVSGVANDAFLSCITCPLAQCTADDIVKCTPGETFWPMEIGWLPEPEDGEDEPSDIEAMIGINGNDVGILISNIVNMDSYVEKLFSLHDRTVLAEHYPFLNRYDFLNDALYVCPTLEFRAQRTLHYRTFARTLVGDLTSNTHFTDSTSFFSESTVQGTLRLSIERPIHVVNTVAFFNPIFHTNFIDRVQTFLNDGYTGSVEYDGFGFERNHVTLPPVSCEYLDTLKRDALAVLLRR